MLPHRWRAATGDPRDAQAVVYLVQALQKMRKVQVISLRSLGEAWRCGEDALLMARGCSRSEDGPGAGAQLGSGWGLGAMAASPPARSQGGCTVPAPRVGFEWVTLALCTRGPCVQGTERGWQEGASAGGLAALLPPPSTTGMQQSAMPPLREPGADLPTATLPASGPSKGWQSPKNSSVGLAWARRSCLEHAQRHPTAVVSFLAPGLFGGYRNTTPPLLTLRPRSCRACVSARVRVPPQVACLHIL